VEEAEDKGRSGQWRRRRIRGRTQRVGFEKLRLKLRMIKLRHGE